VIRRGLPLSEWPEQDRDAWSAAILKEDRFRRGPASHWAPTTHAAVVAAYGRWIGHLAETEPTALAECAVERVTEQRLTGYVNHLAKTAGSVGQHVYLEKLRRAIRVMFPGRVPEPLSRIVARLASECRPRSKAHRMVTTPRLITLGVNLMKGAMRFDGKIADPVDYRDGLMIALLAGRPLRLRTFSLICVGAHLLRVGEEWRMIFDGPETKSGRHFEITVSQSLVPYLDVYLREVRPMFPGADQHRALWASRARRPLTANAIARVISDRTCAAFGQPVSPHLFRHCAATTVATLEPGRIGIARDLLGHASLSTMHTHYNKAKSIEASRVYTRILAGVISEQRRRSCRSAETKTLPSTRHGKVRR
jgi:integrase/recombinase XerD